MLSGVSTLSFNEFTDPAWQDRMLRAKFETRSETEPIVKTAIHATQTKLLYHSCMHKKLLVAQMHLHFQTMCIGDRH